MNIFIPSQLRDSPSPSLRLLFSVYRVLYNFISDQSTSRTKIPWSLQKQTFSIFFALSCTLIAHFPSVHKSIISCIKRHPPQRVFDKVDSAVYIIWSPFSPDFYIGSIDRADNTSPWTRFTEHMQKTFTDPNIRRNLQQSYSHQQFKKQTAGWVMSLVAVNPESPRDYEKYVISKLHPTLNKKQKNFKLRKHLPPRFRDSKTTTNAPHRTNNRFLHPNANRISPALISLETTKAQPSITPSALTTCLDNALCTIPSLPTTTLPTFYFIPGFTALISTRHKRLLHNALVTIRPFHKQSITIFKGFFQHFVTNQASWHAQLLTLTIHHKPRPFNPIVVKAGHGRAERRKDPEGGGAGGR